MSPLLLTLDLPVRIALVEMDGVRIRDDDDGPHAELLACAARYHETYVDGRGVDAPGGVEGVQHARELFRALGIDPTKRRPSSEALLVRALKRKGMPRVNALVDLGNWCSLDFLLPLGLYDRARIAGAVTLRRGRPDERYRAIGDRTMSLEGRYVLADEEGPFGSPITDSIRTSVTPDTSATAVMIYAPAAFPEPRLREHAREMAARIQRFCGGGGVQLETLLGRAA